MDSILESKFAQEIHEEYKKIDEKWLQLHHKAVIYLAVAGLVVEIILVASLYALEHGSIDIGLRRYILKYAVLPVLLNTLCIAVSTFGMQKENLSARVRAYIVSLAMVGICFIFYSVHYNFNIYILFFGPVLLTAIYGEYLMTTVIAAVSIGAKIISDIYVYWGATKVGPFEDGFATIGFVTSIVLLLVFYAISLIIIHFQCKKNEAVIQKEIERYEMQKQLITDHLTKVHNRIALKDALFSVEEDISEIPYYLAMLDLDNFKNLNDTLGHEKGDECLEEIGRLLQTISSQNALPFRLGGDEFCILWRHEEINTIVEVLRNMQHEFGQSMARKFVLDIPVTMSIGVAKYMKQMTSTQLLKKADTALYRAKVTKNTIAISEEDSEDEEDYRLHREMYDVSIL